MTPTHHEQALLLLRFLQQRQRKAELEQTLVLAEAQGSPLVILPRQHIFSWKKNPKVDVQAVRRELSEIEKHPISLSVTGMPGDCSAAFKGCEPVGGPISPDRCRIDRTGAEAGSTGGGLRRCDLAKL